MCWICFCSHKRFLNPFSMRLKFIGCNSWNATHPKHFQSCIQFRAKRHISRLCSVYVEYTVYVESISRTCEHLKKDAGHGIVKQRHCFPSQGAKLAIVICSYNDNHLKMTWSYFSVYGFAILFRCQAHLRNLKLLSIASSPRTPDIQSHWC